jgi:drug/metabolite transporter (DMT)-like permease
VLLAHFFLDDETLTWRKALGVLFALSGAALIALRGESGLAGISRANPWGYVLVLLAIIFGSSMMIYARKFMRNFDPFDVAAIRMLVVTLTIAPVVILFIGIDLHTVNSQGYLSLVYAALAANFGGTFLGFYIIKRFGATASSVADYVIPVVAGLGGILILGEQITPGLVVGMSLIVMGLTLINRRLPSLRLRRPHLEVEG